MEGFSCVYFSIVWPLLLNVGCEVQNTNLNFFTQEGWHDNLPKGVAVDLKGQIGPNEENIDEDTIMV